MSDPTSASQPTEEELRAALEDEMRRVRVEDVLLQAVVSLVNLGARRAGIAAGTEGERDLGQVRTAIEATRALLPVLEPLAAEQAAAIRDAVSQLQLAYVRAGGGEAAAPAAGAEPAAGEPTRPEGEPSGPGPGPAQSSGRLWVPGQ